MIGGNLVAWLACACLLTAHAQYRFDHWTTDNGLPQNSVRDIVQARDGYLWLATFDGLVRFDGVRFTVFNKSNSPGLPSNRFIYLFEDRRGDLWAVLENGEIVRRHQGRFTTYAPAQGVPTGIVPQLGEDEQGNLLLYHLMYRIEGLYWGAEFTARVWRWSGDRFEPAEDLRAVYSGPRVSLAENPALKYFRIIAGEVWIATPERVIRFLKGGGAQVYSEQTGLPGKQPRLILSKQGMQHVMTRDATGRLWLTELKSMQSQLINQREPEGLNGLSVFADSEGNYWFDTYGNGLFRARRQTITPLGKAQGLSTAEVYPLLESRDGTLWIGTLGAGIFRYKDGALQPYWPIRKRENEFHGFVTHSLYEDHAGQMYVNGLWRLAEQRYVPETWKSALSSLGVWNYWTMCQERAGAYWVGTDLGVIRIENGSLTHFTTKDGLAGNDTKVIIEDGQGGLWLGSYGGITHYRDGKFTAWTEKEGLPGNTVRALQLDSDGTLWIGTYDSGLGRFKDGCFTRYTTKDGLFDNGVFQMLEDDFGWCWMSSNRGLYRVRKQELNDFAEGKISAINCLAYNKSDGMPSTECNGGRWPAGVKTRDGKLWFPTMEGVAIVDPANVKANSQPPPVVLEEMRINNQPMANEVWQSAILNPNSAISMLPGQDNFEIAYTALSFINSENMRFKYKLEGADADWVDAGTRRTAYFSHLAPGAYTFRVIAANADGVWNEAGAHLRIRIVPPFYRTWWFLTLSTLAVAGAVFTAIRSRVRQVEAREAAQQAFAQQLIESQEQERKRIAAELHDSLGQQLLVIKNWAMIGLNAPNGAAQPHEPLAEISTTASQAIDDVRQVVYDLRPYQLDKIGLANTLRFMIEKVGAAAGLEIHTEFGAIDEQFSYNEQVTLYRIVQECVNNIVKHAQATIARVAITPHGETVRVLIEDNGRGFVVAQRQGSGFGLQGLHERVRILKGEMTIDSAPRHGTKIQITIDRKQKL